MTLHRLVAILAISWGVFPLGMNEPAFAQKGFAGCLPVSERSSEIGCWILASEPVGQLPPHPVFWHLDKFSTSALAERAKDPRGTVLQSLGKVWLLTIAEAGWRPNGGDFVPISFNQLDYAEIPVLRAIPAWSVVIMQWKMR